MKLQKKPLLLGAHFSIAGSLDNAINEAESLNCSCMQIFTENNRRWNNKKIDSQDAKNFQEKLNKSQIKYVISHASYLINIASGDPTLNNKSVNALVAELDRCTALNIPYLVLHPGNAINISKEKAIELIAENLSKILDNNCGTTIILLENTAGQGNSLGSTFDELAKIRMKSFHQERIGFCFDTCHAFAAGYDLRTPIAYKDTLNLFDQVADINNLKVIHLNDSKKELGSRVDRHANIGLGYLGLTTFENILNDERFFDVPKILETPKDPIGNQNADAYNINTLTGLLNKKVENF